MRVLAILLFALFACLATPALADPCRAITDSGKWPGWLKPGQPFEGVVRYVGDGDSLCVGRTADPAEWVEVRLGDFNAPELSEAGGPAAKTLLTKLVLGHRVRCVAEHRSWDRAVSLCTLAGVRLGDLLRDNGGVEGGR